jgi:hypothetical protein
MKFFKWVSKLFLHPTSFVSDSKDLFSVIAHLNIEITMIRLLEENSVNGTTFKIFILFIT